MSFTCPTSTYYYYLEDTSCSTIEMGVGILRPNWLLGAKYLGQATVDNLLCDVWQQGSSPDDDSVPFITYYNQVGTEVPARWVFFDGASFDVMKWEINGTVPEATWQVPAFCFTENRTPLASALGVKISGVE